jgi:hypothetical protein
MVSVHDTEQYPFFDFFYSGMSSVRGKALISLQMYLNILHSIVVLLLYCCAR